MLETESLTLPDKILSSLVFGCPNCQQPFQVGATQAGQVVQCPTCAQSVEIPADAFENALQSTAPPTAPEDPIVFECPMCQGQFGVTQSMHGQKVACPHCQAPTLVQIKSNARQENTETLPPPVIKTNVPISKTQKREIKKRAKRKQKPKLNKELFAPEPKPPADTAPMESSSTPQNQAKTKPDSSGKPTKDPRSGPPSKPQPKKQKWRGATPPAKPPEPESPPPATTDLVETTNPHPPSVAAIEIKPLGDVAIVEDAKVEIEVEVDAKAEDSDPSIAHLLPPKFTAMDPGRLRVNVGGDQFKIMLPDGKGGMAQMDNRVLHVKHGEEKVSLISLTPSQKARRRLIQNIIAILIGIAVMALAFTILV